MEDNSEKTSELQKNIDCLEQEIQALKNIINNLNNFSETISSCIFKWEKQGYIYKLILSSAMPNRFEGNSKKTANKIVNDAYSKMENNYTKANKISQGITSQISKLENVISEKNNKLSEKNEELRGYVYGPWPMPNTY